MGIMLQCSCMNSKAIQCKYVSIVSKLVKIVILFTRIARPTHVANGHNVVSFPDPTLCEGKNLGTMVPFLSASSTIVIICIGLYWDHITICIGSYCRAVATEF